MLRTVYHPAVAPLKEVFPAVKFLAQEFRGQVTLVVPRENILEVCGHLRRALGYDQLIDLSSTDYLGFPRQMPGRFGVNYSLLNHATNTRLWLKVFLTPTQSTGPGTSILRDEVVAQQGDPGLKIDSVYGVWPAADWLEREQYDLMGIIFVGHPDLRRLMTWNGFGSHPLRKDYPLRGIGEREDYKVVSRDGA